MATWRAGARGPRIIASPRQAGHREVGAARTSPPLPPPLPPAITSIRASLDAAERCAAENTATARHVGVAPSIVNNNPEAGARSRRSFPTAAGWCVARPAVARRSRDSGFVARIERSEMREPSAPDFASLNPGYDLSHHVKQPLSFPRRVFAPGVLTFASPTRIEGWAERRETFGCSAEHPLDTP